MGTTAAAVLSLGCLSLGLIPAGCIKIGISQDVITSSSTTSTSTTTTISPGTISITTESPLAPTTNTDASSFTDAASTSTPIQTFPPRKVPRATTTSPPKSTSTAVPTVDSSSGTSLVTSKPEVIPQRQAEFYYCDCDLFPNQCEINCCCDQDCPPESLQVFNCLKSSAAPQLQARLEDFQYTHGLPACQLNDGWLCVFRSNTKPPKPQVIPKHFDAELFNKWTDQLVTYEASSSSHYKFGDSLELWQPEMKQMSHLEMPVGHESAHCQLRQSIRYLEHMQSSCLMKDAAQVQQHLWSIVNLTMSHQLLAKPREPEDQEPLQLIDFEICQQLLQQPQVTCQEHDNNTELELIAVDNFKLELVHNYTNILTAKLLLQESNLTEEHDPNWLTYEVTYKAVDEVPKRPASGPLGYLLGSPLILARLQPQNNSEQALTLDYFQGNLSQKSARHWLNLCHENDDPNHPVAFGVDLSKQCLLRNYHATMEQTLNNHTQLCVELQSRIWRQLLPHNCSQLNDLGQIFISQLGRPQPDQWLPLQLQHESPPIQGSYNDLEQTLTCRNMYLSVAYEFHVAEMTLLHGHVPHQQVVQHARLVLGQRHDLELETGDQQLMELPLGVTVMFFKPQSKRLNSGNQVVLSSGLLLLTLIASRGQ